MTRPLNPSLYELPHRTSFDRERGRRASLQWAQRRYKFKIDELFGAPGPGFRLPPYVARMTKDLDFSLANKARLSASKLQMRLNNVVARARLPESLEQLSDYEKLYTLVSPPPGARQSFREDAAFARQRLTGVNPMQIRRVQAPLSDAYAPLINGALETLHERYGENTDLSALIEHKRLFYTEYPLLWDPRIQQQVTLRRRYLAAPTCLFIETKQNTLMPFAIQLKPPTEPGNPVFTPTATPQAWAVAKAHVQASDSHYHESIYHFLETHLLSECIGLSLFRQVHPNHPVRQLMQPHYENNAAINNVARHNLLTLDGPMDRGMAAGVAALLDLARMEYCSNNWSFGQRTLHEDLKARGLDDDEVLRGLYPYRTDAKAHWSSMEAYVGEMVELWYRRPDDVQKDKELNAWFSEIHSPAFGAIESFPAQVHDRDALVQLLTHLMFRCSVQHAAVNNGQYDTYGWIPNAPGMLMAPLPSESQPRLPDSIWTVLPQAKEAMAQIGMVWVLSQPTQSSMLEVGEMPAFDRALNPRAHSIVLKYRRALQRITEDIQARNVSSKSPYTYLLPQYVSQSTQI